MAGYKRRTTTILARWGAIAGLSLVAGLMVTNLWTETQAPGSSQKHSSKQNSDQETTGLEILKTQAQKHPSDWRWSLLLARAQHEQGDRNAAWRTLKPLQRLHPDRPEVMTLWAHLSMEADQGAALIKRLNDRFQSIPAERRLNLGLLLADLERLSGDSKAASDRYRNLIKENPSRAEPLLAFALLKRDQGQGSAAVALLRKAMSLEQTMAPTSTDLQSFELRWALEAARNKPVSPGVKAVKTL